MMALLRLFVSLLLLVAALFFGLWDLLHWGLIAFMASVALAQTAVRLPKEHRQSQWPLPLAVLLFGLAYWAGLVWLRSQYLAFTVSQAALLDELARFGLAIPRDIGGFIPWANALFMAAFGFLKALFIIVYRLVLSPIPEGCPYGIAYALAPGYPTAWALKPQWLAVRWLALAAALVGGAGLCLTVLAYQGQIPGGWIPLFPAGLLVFALETVLWLWGKPPECRPLAEFTGDDNLAVGEGDFSALWRRYRSTWAGQWKAAGNRLPTGKA